MLQVIRIQVSSSEHSTVSNRYTRRHQGVPRRQPATLPPLRPPINEIRIVNRDVAQESQLNFFQDSQKVIEALLFSDIQIEHIEIEIKPHSFRLQK